MSTATGPVRSPSPTPSSSTRRASSCRLSSFRLVRGSLTGAHGRRVGFAASPPVELVTEVLLRCRNARKVKRKRCCLTTLPPPVRCEDKVYVKCRIDGGCNDYTKSGGRFVLRCLRAAALLGRPPAGRSRTSLQHHQCSKSLFEPVAKGIPAAPNSTKPPLRPLSLRCEAVVFALSWRSSQRNRVTA